MRTCARSGLPGLHARLHTHKQTFITHTNRHTSYTPTDIHDTRTDQRPARPCHVPPVRAQALSFVFRLCFVFSRVSQPFCLHSLSLGFRIEGLWLVTLLSFLSILLVSNTLNSSIVLVQDLGTNFNPKPQKRSYVIMFYILLFYYLCHYHYHYDN